MKTLFLPAVVLFLSVAPVLGAEPQYPPPPWHLVDLWWDIGREQPLESYSVDVTISDDVPSTTNLYIAPIGIAHLNKIPFYGGIQTQSDGYTKRDQHLRKIGPGFIFSMWGERSLDAIRPSIGGFCQSSGHEGDFVSVRRPYQWEKGKYTYEVVRMDKQEIDGKPFTWVGVFVFSHDKGENVFVGALRFKGESLVLSGKVASFVEIYGGRIPVSQIPRLTVTFGKEDCTPQRGLELIDLQRTVATLGEKRPQQPDFGTGITDGFPVGRPEAWASRRRLLPTPRRPLADGAKSHPRPPTS